MSHDDPALNKTERLFALVLLLQNRPNLTSRDLADHFGVSRRTIFRDLRALSESGVPLTYAEEGGYEILEGYQLPPLMFTAREAATLLVGTEFTKLQPDTSLRADADAVALKIRSVLPPAVQTFIDRLQASTVIQPFMPDLNPRQARDDEEGRWFELSEAVARQRVVQMAYYVQSRDEVTERAVNPLGLVYYSDHWNLIAYDELRRDIRNFRLDMIRAMKVTQRTFERPKGFDLKAHLRERGTSPRNLRMALRFTERAYRWARASFPADIEDEHTHDGGVDVTFAFENIDYIARWLLRYGTEVKVLEPPALQARVRDLALALARQYDRATS